MEGDAKGQVGGLDMSAGQRERLARESRGWRCGGCGGRNEDVLAREGDRAREIGEGVKVEVPEELRLGFKDQMGEAKEAKGKGKESEGEGVERKEGELKREPVEKKEVAQTVVAPAGPAIALHAPPTAGLASQRVSTDGVPAWVDKAITGVAAALALLIIKKILV